MNLMYLRFGALALTDLLINIFGWLTNWFWAMWGGRDGNLPRYIKWFQTHDATLDGVGMDGSEEPRFVASTEWLRGADGAGRNWICTYLIRVMWLYRNNVYGFSYFLLGAAGPFTFVGDTIELFPPVIGDSISDRYPAQAGSWNRLWRSNGRDYFQYRYVKDRGNGKCFEANIGWKISAASERAQLVLRWTPWRTFESEQRTS